ncbi:MAG: cupin domain-containing protein [Candidatus Eremiobacteraeota bacterium]|nr:cupin domain-containing protein [Candidatus Eremiobacteraeota bacterium]
MRFSSLIFAGLSLAAGGAAVAAMTGAPVLMAPQNMHWIAGTGPAKGTSGVVFVGDPNKSGTAIIRVKMPDGYVNQPHYHSHTEYITVMQGALLFGTGDAVNKSKGTTLPTGSFIMVPAGVHHWSIAQGETIEQIGGEGPLSNIPIKRTGM